MLKTLYHLLAGGVQTIRDIPTRLPDEARGLPRVVKTSCPDACCLCIDVCPTDAITLLPNNTVKLDLGRCITCAQCTDICAPGVIAKSTNTSTAVRQRNELSITNAANPVASIQEFSSSKRARPFRFSAACRVVSTGCSACDLEIAACSNAIFDVERFGVTVVASPRFADILLVTGPVPKSMHNALRSCYEAMAEPRRVIAVGSCAISGGVHADGYADANGLCDILPVDGFIPGCPPHPWSIIDGIRMVMGYEPLFGMSKAYCKKTVGY